MANGNGYKKDKVIRDFICYLKAGYPYFYITTTEMTRSLNALMDAVKKYNDSLDEKEKEEKEWKSIVWDTLGAPGPDGKPTIDDNLADPEEMIQGLIDLPRRTVCFLKNFNWYLRDDYGNPQKQITTLLQNNYNAFCKKDRRKVIVVLSDVTVKEGLPDMVRADFLPLSFELPDEDELMEVLEKLVKAAKRSKKDFKEPSKEEKERLVDAALSLTLQEAENAFAYCLVKHGKFDPKVVDRIKAKQIEGIPGVKYIEPTNDFKNLVGFDLMKVLAMKSLQHKDGKGISVVGPPGTGKTEFFKCLTAASGMRCLWAELAETQGGIVGDTERNVRNLIGACVAMAGSKGVILVFDEMEKGLAGASAGAGTVSSDSIQRRAMGQILKFMQDPGCRVWFAATFNSIEGVDGEYLRAERWDTSPFYIALPNGNQRKAILKHYKEVYGAKGELTTADTEGWSGAELKAVCRISNMLGMSLKDGKKYIVPISVTKADQIKKLDDWAKRGAVPATSLEETKVAERDIDF